MPNMFLSRLLSVGLLFCCVVNGDIPQFTHFEFVEVPTDLVVSEGQSAVLSCQASYGDSYSSIVYSWMQNNQLLSPWQTSAQNRLKLTNGSLLFSNLHSSSSVSYTGNYRCIAEVLHNSKTKRITSPTAQLSMARVGEFAAQPEDMEAALGENVMFQCRIDSLPTASYTWTKNGQTVSTQAGRILIHGDGEVLELLSIGKNDYGSYECIASNAAGSKRSSSGLLKQPVSSDNAPVFSLRPQDVMIIKNTDVTLYCSVYGRGRDGEIPTITWLHQGSSINIGSSNGHLELFGAGSLRIYNVTERDNGLYTCRGANSNDVSDSEASLSVLVAPYFVSDMSNTYGRVNEDVTLKCDVKGIPAPQIKWYKDSYSVTDSAYFDISGNTLIIRGLMRTDSGYFQCIGENSVGKVSGTAELIVLSEEIQFSPVSPGSQRNVSSPPPAPINLNAAITSHTYVTLKWSAPLLPVRGYTVSVSATAQPSSDQQDVRVRTANTSSTDYTMQGLQPSTDYVFKVFSYNSFGRSREYQELRVRTAAEAAVPSAVTNFRAYPTSHHNIDVTFNPPSIMNGEIIEYRVYYYSTDQSHEKNKSTSHLYTTLKGLHPYTTYHIRVVAYNGNGEGTPSSEINVRTHSSKPSKPPRNVTGEAVSATSVLLRWLSPPISSMNGQITGYKIRYKAKLSFARPRGHTTDADARSFEVIDLEPETDYLFKVGAVNINGTGEMSPWIELRTTNTELDESRPPNQPLYIRAEPLVREMIIYWKPPDDDILIRGYRLGYGSTTPDEHWETVSAGAKIYTLHKLKPLTSYVIQLIAYNRAGSSTPAMQQAFTKPAIDDGATQLKAPVGINVEIISSTTAVVRWYDPTLGQNQRVNDDRVYTVKYNALSGLAQRKTEYRNTTQLVLEVDNLRPYTRYEFAVRTVRGKRKSVYSLTVRDTTSADRPGSPPEDLTVKPSRKGSNYVLLSWQPPTRPNGRLIHYLIYYTLGEWEDNSLPIEVPGHLLNYDFGPVASGRSYKFKLTAVNSKGRSPFTEVATAITPLLDKTISKNIIKSTPADVSDKSTPPNAGVEQVPSDHQKESLFDSPYILWIIIGCVTFIMIIAIGAFIAFICIRRNRSNNKRQNEVRLPPAPNMSCDKPQPPDLWPGHETVRLNPLSSTKSESEDPDEMTSMLQSSFDVSASMAGDISLRDYGANSSLNRLRPVVVASGASQKCLTKVPSMSADPSRPLYPKTQFASGGQYSSTPRVHVGDTSQPSSEHYHQHHYTQHVSSVDGLGPAAAAATTLDSPRSNALSNFSIPAPPPAYQTISSLPRQIVKPQTPETGTHSSVTRSSGDPSPSHLGTGSLRRPTRHMDASTDQKENLMTQSTEQLSAEMMNLDCIMQDLNAMKSEFEMT